MSNILTSQRVREVLEDCMHTEEEVEGKSYDEIIKDSLVVEGIASVFAFVPEKVESHREDVRAMLGELNPTFHKSSGGGWSFLNMCMTKDDEQWTGLHQEQEALCVLAIALNLGSWLLPRSMWSAMPGGVPYFVTAL